MEQSTSVKIIGKYADSGVNCAKNVLQYLQT
jgi:hypothetical protein